MNSEESNFLVRYSEPSFLEVGVANCINYSIRFHFMSVKNAKNQIIGLREFNTQGRPK